MITYSDIEVIEKVVSIILKISRLNKEKKNHNYHKHFKKILIFAETKIQTIQIPFFGYKLESFPF